jgi:hypothetical protein
MMKKRFFVLAVVMTVIPASTSLAAIYTWTGSGADRLWSNASNWDSNHVPTSTDPWCDITPAGGGPLIDSSVAAVFGSQMDLGWENGGGNTSTLDMTGGTLTGGKLGIGTYYYGSGEKSVLNLSAGTVTLSTSIIVGSRTAGVLNMTGGTINALGGLQISAGAGSNPTQQQASSGDVHLDGGVLTASYLTMCTAGANAGSGHLDITGGKLILNASQLGTVNGYIGNGWITGYGDGSKVVVTTVGDTIELTAVPEPVTIGLMLIGGVMGCIRRKA